MTPNAKAHETMSAFQQYLSTNIRVEIEAFSLAELRSADEQYGHRDLKSGFRIALQNRIKEIEEEKAELSAKSIRWTSYGLMFVIAFSSSFMVYYLTND